MLISTKTLSYEFLEHSNVEYTIVVIVLCGECLVVARVFSLFCNGCP